MFPALNLMKIYIYKYNLIYVDDSNVEKVEILLNLFSSKDHPVDYIVYTL